VLVQERPDPSEIFVWNGLARVAELIDDLLHTNRIPDHSGVAQQAKATGFIHDFH
jgi:hypothetical protein